jgi:hypothetical protein
LGNRRYKGERMTALTYGHRRLADLSVSELVDIRMLNNNLLKSEYWIRRNVARLRGESVVERAAQVDAYASDDADLRIEVCCTLREFDPHFDRDSRNIVARLDGRTILDADAANHFDAGNDLHVQTSHLLPEMRVCHLFRALYEQGAQRNWDVLVRIGEISVEISHGHRLMDYRGASYRQ